MLRHCEVSVDGMAIKVINGISDIANIIIANELFITRIPHGTTECVHIQTRALSGDRVHAVSMAYSMEPLWWALSNCS